METHVLKVDTRYHVIPAKGIISEEENVTYTITCDSSRVNNGCIRCSSINTRLAIFVFIMGIDWMWRRLQQIQDRYIKETHKRKQRAPNAGGHHHCGCCHCRHQHHHRMYVQAPINCIITLKKCSQRNEAKKTSCSQSSVPRGSDTQWMYSLIHLKSIGIPFLNAIYAQALFNCVIKLQKRKKRIQKDNKTKKETGPHICLCCWTSSPDLLVLHMYPVYTHPTTHHYAQAPINCDITLEKIIESRRRKKTKNRKEKKDQKRKHRFPESSSVALTVRSHIIIPKSFVCTGTVQLLHNATKKMIKERRNKEKQKEKLHLFPWTDHLLVYILVPIL